MSQNQERRDANTRSDAADTADAAQSSEPDQDLVIDFNDVSLVRSGKTLVGPLTWQVELDERWVVLGPNGAGKTSLMRIAGAEVFPTSGRANVLGQTLGRAEMADLRIRIGMSSAATVARIPADEMVSDLVISAGYSVLGRWHEQYDEVDYARAADILESMGAEHLRERKWGTLSEGERKRVLIARALMTDPEMLLLDEPAAGLDLGGREELVTRLSELAMDPDAPALVLITHHVEEIPPGFTHALLLSEGEITAMGLIEDVITSENLTRTFAMRIVVESVDGRYFARRVRKPGRHRR